MYEGNPGEIDFGSSSREIRVSVGSVTGCQLYNKETKKKKKKKEREIKR